MTTSHIPPHTAISADAVGAPPVPQSRGRRTAEARAAGPVRWYVRERWLVVLLGAFVPMAIALRLPLDLRAPLVGVSLIMAASGLVLLWCRAPGSTADDWYAEPALPPAGPATPDARLRPNGSEARFPAAPHETGSRELA